MPDLPAHERAALGSVLRQLRSREGVTQEQLADAASVSRKWVGDVEHSRHRPSWDGVVLVARALGVDLAEFGTLYEAEVRRLRKRAR